jgi:hypothetical protein
VDWGQIELTDVNALRTAARRPGPPFLVVGEAARRKLRHPEMGLGGKLCMSA